MAKKLEEGSNSSWTVSFMGFNKCLKSLNERYMLSDRFRLWKDGWSSHHKEVYGLRCLGGLLAVLFAMFDDLLLPLLPLQKVYFQIISGYLFLH